MRITVPIVLSMLSVATAGCGSVAVDPYQQAAQEVASAAAALEQEGTDEAALDGLEDDEPAVGQDGDDAEEAAEQAARGDGGVRDGRHDRGGQDRGRHPHGRHHGRGRGLLLWFADLDALQACRDVREQCLATATATDEASCKDEVRACVQPVLEQAFAAMCEEKLAMCEADDASERHCAKIAAHCGGDDADTDDGPEAPDAG